MTRRPTIAGKKTNENTQAKKMDAAVAVGKKSVKRIIQAGKDALAMINTKKTVKITGGQVEAASKTLFTGHDKVTAFKLPAFDASATAYKTMTGGAKELVEKITNYAPKSVKASVDKGQVFVAFTSVDEAIDPRGKMTSVAFDSAVVQGTKITELSLKTANEGWAPVQDQI